MPIASWNGQTIAESEQTEVVEGNHYFPRSAVRDELLIDSDHSTHCPWKGDARYFHIKVGDEINENAAWYYPHPKSAAAQIKDHVAFWKGVTVSS